MEDIKHLKIIKNILFYNLKLMDFLRKHMLKLSKIKCYKRGTNLAC